MFKWIFTFIFTNVLVTIYAPRRPSIQSASTRPIILHHWNVIDMEQMNDFLDTINPSEVLPIVLFQTKLQYHTLETPDDIFSATIWEKKIVNGTKFFMRGATVQIFFCPKLVPNKYTQKQEWCLAPQDFENLEPLRCANVPVPTVIPTSYPICGFPSTNFSYAMAYEFCDTERYKYRKNAAFSIYDFCFDATNKKTLYTSHAIRSAKLLESKLLYRERQLVYDYLYVDGLPTANQEMIQRLLNPQSSSTNTLYRVQQLVPEEDMAFAHWRKPTRQFLNTELQHWLLFDIWNEINSTVRAEAIRAYDVGYTFCITTGVFDNGSDLPKSTDGQMYNKWVKVITVKKLPLDTVESAGVVILMNNFVNFQTDNPALQSVQNELNALCPTDVCPSNDFKNRIEILRGQMRCCMINPLIAQLFNLRINPNLPLLHILGLTVPLPES